MLLSILAFVFVLGVLVFIHELGHFLTAKWVGVKVHVFSLGFPPKLVGKQWGDTEYRIGLLPLGGYVKMAGESPTEASGRAEEFHSRSKLERVAILVMGPAMNLVLALGVFTALFMVGLERPAGLEDPPIVRFVSEDSPAGRAGIQPGDQIVSVDGERVENWREALDIFLINANQTLDVALERDGERVRTELEVEARGEDQVGYTGLFPAVQPQVARLREDFPAEKAGLEPGDIIIGVDGKDIVSNQELIEAIESKQGESIRLRVLRNGKQLQFELTPVEEGDRYLIGIEFPAPVVVQQIRNPVKALGAAFQECSRITELTFVVLGRMIQGRASIRQMSGPIGIARMSGETARRGAGSLFTLMAILSLNLGILNLLPIPILDGGHIAIIVLEGLARRDFSLQAKERILQIGFLILLLLMVTVIYVDLSKIESIGRFLPWR